MHRGDTGFTLIELLVVVTLIVILLALIAPALDSAIYQAELVACGARQRGVTSGAILYTYDFRKRYPNRPGNREAEDTTSFAPFHLKSRTDNNPLNARDVRPIIADYIDTPLLPCPLSGDLDIGVEATRDVDRVYGGFNLFFGFTYTKTPDYQNLNNARAAERGMIKMGDRWTFTNATGEHAFNLLTTDIDWEKYNGEAFGSHPDAWDTLNNYRAEGVDSPWLLDGSVTWSWWQKGETATPPTRGPLDMNAGRDDGSVSRSRVHAAKDRNPDLTDIAMFDTRFGYDGEWMFVPVN